MARRFANTHEVLDRDEPVTGSSDRTLGLVFAVFFSAVGLLPLLRHHAMRPWALVIAAVFLIAALASPSVLRPINFVWTRLGLLLQTVTNPIILGALFYLVVTPFALICRLLGKDMLKLRFEPAADTYWLPRNPPGPPPESMRNQF
jgi:saxitoxin biosynthesis operon SxtJ-like protein